MEKKLRKLRTDPRVTMFLLPLPKAVASTVKDVDKPAAPPAAKLQPSIQRPPKRAKVSAKSEDSVPTGAETLCTERSKWPSDLLGLQHEVWLQE